MQFRPSWHFNVLAIHRLLSGQAGAAVLISGPQHHKPLAIRVFIISIRTMTILNTHTTLALLSEQTAETKQIIADLVAGARVYFWWYGFGYFSQESGVAS